jgi:hypothetical protein
VASKESTKKEFGTKWGRGFALVSRCFVLLLIAYVISHKMYPGDKLDIPLAQLTFNGLLSLVIGLGLSLATGLYFLYHAFNPPPNFERDQSWYEGWQSAGIIIPIFFAWFVYTLSNPPTKEPFVSWFETVITVVAWILF